MAYDGIITMAVAKELRQKLTGGKIDKIYQPESDQLVFNVHTRQENLKLFASVDPSAARLHLMQGALMNPPSPFPFCMLLRKHLQGGRITDVAQKGSERIIELFVETLNELGFSVSKKLVFEIMGKHSNVALVELSSGRIIDSIKRVSIDVNRVRQLLPGVIYSYPPAQDKTPFKELPEDAILPRDAKAITRLVAGVSSSLAEEMSAHQSPAAFLHKVINAVEDGEAKAFIYFDDGGVPREFHVTPLGDYDSCRAESFDSVSECIQRYYDNKAGVNNLRQRSGDLCRAVSAQLSKLRLKEQRLSEDLLRAENSEDLRLFGELLTANIHAVKPGAEKVTVTNYYDGSSVTIPLDKRFSPSKNAQQYFKRYGKAKTAVKEKQAQLSINEQEIAYLESVLSFAENARDAAEVDELRRELEETGYLKKRRIPGGFKEKKFKAEPYAYTLKNGMTVLAGRNNRENDALTFKTASSKDIWFHTKDIPGSHVILRCGGAEADAETIYAAAAIAAYHSKGRSSENVPVDYVAVKNVKKPAGAKPGMVIFTGNRTVWVDPALPE